MQSRAHARHVRITPRKVSAVLDLVRGKDAVSAVAILKNTPKSASPVVEKLVKSAMANAENNHNMNVSNLYIKEIFAGPGPTLKRVMPRARGSASRINKRTSHITVVLEERE